MAKLTITTDGFVSFDADPRFKKLAAGLYEVDIEDGIIDVRQIAFGYRMGVTYKNCSTGICNGELDSSYIKNSIVYYSGSEYIFLTNKATIPNIKYVETLLYPGGSKVQTKIKNTETVIHKVGFSTSVDTVTIYYINGCTECLTPAAYGGSAFIGGELSVRCLGNGCYTVDYSISTREVADLILATNDAFYPFISDSSKYICATPGTPYKLYIAGTDKTITGVFPRCDINEIDTK